MRPLLKPSRVATAVALRPGVAVAAADRGGELNDYAVTPAATRRDEHSGVIWFAQECRRNGIRLEPYIRLAEGAGDAKLADFFRRAQRLTWATARSRPQLIPPTPAPGATRQSVALALGDPDVPATRPA